VGELIGHNRPVTHTDQLGEGALRRLLEVGRSLVAHLDLEAILAELLEVAREVTRARYAAIGVLDESRSGLERFITRGIDPEAHASIGDLPRGRGVLGVLIEEPEPLRLDDVGEHPQSYGFPAGHPVMRSFLGVPIRIRGEAWGNLYLTEKGDGEPFTPADEAAVIVLADWASVAIENARLYEDAQSRRIGLEHAVRRLEATTAVARALGTETELDRVLELIVKRARALVEARSIVLLLKEGEDVVVAARAGQVDSRAVGTRIPCAASVMGEVLRKQKAERLDDVGARLALDDQRLGVVGAETGMLVPLVYRGESLGVLAAFDRLGERDPRFGDDDEGLLQAFAASAATAVATAKTVAADRLQDSLQAAERERRRWARELHDETLQGLAGLRVMLASGLRSGDPGKLEAVVREAVDQVAHEVESLRTLITELRPAALDELGLAPAIESLTRRLGTVEGLEMDVELALGAERFDEDVETTAYRLVQEALSNVAKHARATAVRVHARRERDTIEIEVADDGQGFDTAERGDGFGLVGMRERVGLVGGSVDVSSSAAGTTVRASVPVVQDTRSLSSA
jgi:signal transduction histidine kinase